MAARGLVNGRDPLRRSGRDSVLEYAALLRFICGNSGYSEIFVIRPFFKVRTLFSSNTGRNGFSGSREPEP